jgi:hypothetical protein
MSCFGPRIRRLRIGEALWIFSEIAHGVVSSIRFCERAVSGVAKILGALCCYRHIHSSGESGTGRGLCGTGIRIL